MDSIISIWQDMLSELPYWNMPQVVLNDTCECKLLISTKEKRHSALFEAQVVSSKIQTSAMPLQS